MLLFGTLREAAIIKRFNRFLTSVPYIGLVCLLALISNTLSAELPVYTVLIALAAAICLLGDDLLGLIPLVACAYMTPSAANNPGRNGQSVFATHGVYILCLLAVLAAALLVRVIADRKQFFTKRYKLLPGICLLGIGYVLSGIGSPAYPELAVKNILFALVQFAAIVLPYLLISGGVRWDRARSDYLAWTGFGMGCLLLCEILGVYATGNVIVNGEIDRTRIFTGWGMYNNMGGMLAMMIPFAFYLAAKYHRGWLGSVAGAVFLIGVLLTCSRNSIFTGCAAFVLCSLLMLITAKNRRGNLHALLVTAGITLVFVLIFHRQILRLFSELLSLGIDPNHRDGFYEEGFRQFAQYPIFGGSFYPIDFTPWDWSTQSEFSSIFPPRWHNTVVQLAACCGVVGMGAYLFHRYQTVRLLLKDWNREKAFIGCAIFVLLVTSLFDCHFFNIGPVLFYAMALAFGENCIGTKDEGLEKGLATLPHNMVKYNRQLKNKEEHHDFQ